jgi:hypothetical protein
LIKSSLVSSCPRHYRMVSTVVKRRLLSVQAGVDVMDGEISGTRKVLETEVTLHFFLFHAQYLMLMLVALQGAG